MEHLYSIFQNIWNRIGNLRPSDSARYRGRGVIWIIPLLITALFFISISHAEVKAKEEVNKDDAAKSQAQVTYGNLPLYFIQNDGQLDGRVKFYEKGNGHTTYFTREGVYLSLVTDSRRDRPSGLSTQPEKQSQETLQKAIPSPLGWEGKGGGNLTSELIKLTFLDANPNPEIVAEGVQEGKVNYFIGNDTRKWRTNIPTHQAVIYKEVYPGIDIKFYGNNRQIEYDIIIGPGADPSTVKFAYEGIEGLKVAESGDMEVAIKEGKIIQKKPYIYQEIEGNKVEISGKFKVMNEVAYTFEVAAYDKKHPLIIDPALAWSTYLGGGSDDYGAGIAVANIGNTSIGVAYITGYTYSVNFPATSLDPGNPGSANPPIPEVRPYRPMYGTLGGSIDAFVTKIKADGAELIYSTYIGGGADDYGMGIAVASGNAYITGYTSSSDFPRANAIYTTFGGEIDAFVTKINADGTALVYSTYLGGGSGDSGAGIAVDTSGNAYITGTTTSSSNFPTASAIYPTFRGGFSDAFVTKINDTGTALAYSTYFGGGDSDMGNDIAVDTSGNAYITGLTSSSPSGFPLVSAIDGTLGGSSDAFVTKINAAGSALVYSTYLGGGDNEGDNEIGGIAVDTSGNAYITGTTGSSDFPTANAIYDTPIGGGDAFVTKINAAGSALVYSTYLGGGFTDMGKK